MPERYTYIWEFTVPAAARAAFESHYNSEGSWVQLFRGHGGYISTVLLRDREDPHRYLTLDSWESEEAYRTFRTSAAAEYERLDQLCEGLATRELFIGAFYEPAA